MSFVKLDRENWNRFRNSITYSIKDQNMVLVIILMKSLTFRRRRRPKRSLAEDGSVSYGSPSFYFSFFKNISQKTNKRTQKEPRSRNLPLQEILRSFTHEPARSSAAKSRLHFSIGKIFFAYERRDVSPKQFYLGRVPKVIDTMGEFRKCKGSI